MKNCKFCWLISLVLAMAVAFLAYLFIVRGAVAPSEDGRTAILLKGSERDFVLAEMRGFLEGVEEITAAIGENDMKTVAEVSTRIGSADAARVPLSLMSKLPIEFKTLGMGTHGEFDELATIATTSGDAKAVITKLANILGNCTTCHSSYRLGVEGEGL